MSFWAFSSTRATGIQYSPRWIIFGANERFIQAARMKSYIALQGHTSTHVYCAWIAIRQKQTRSGLPTSLQLLQQCPNTHTYSYDPIGRYSFSCAHSWRKRSFVLKIIQHVECRTPIARVPESAQNATAHWRNLLTPTSAAETALSW